MIYEYLCDNVNCNKRFDVVKPAKESRNAERCPKCEANATRQFTSNIQIVGASVIDAEYYHAFGKVVKNKRHRKDLMKRHGVEEVGNEKPETIHKHFDKTRATKREKNWEKV